MVQYKCQRCGFETNYKGNIRRHLTRAKPCEPLLGDIDISQQLEQLEKCDGKHTCWVCKKGFSSKWNLDVHSQKHLDDPDKLIMMKEIQELKKIVSNLNCGTNTTIQNQQNNNITQNLFVVQQAAVPRNNFGQESVDHITSEFVREALLNLQKGAVDLVQKVHYDPEVPRNNNIAFKSAKSKQVNAVVQGTWQRKPISTAVEGIVRKVLQLMSSRINEYLDDDELQENRDHIYKWMHDVLNMNNEKYYKLKQDITSLIQNQTELYNPMLEDKLQQEQPEHLSGHFLRI